MARKHQYIISAASTRQKAGRKWRRQARQRLEMAWRHGAFDSPPKPRRGSGKHAKNHVHPHAAAAEEPWGIRLGDLIMEQIIEQIKQELQDIRVDLAKLKAGFGHQEQRLTGHEWAIKLLVGECVVCPKHQIIHGSIETCPRCSLTERDDDYC